MTFWNKDQTNLWSEQYKFDYIFLSASSSLMNAKLFSTEVVPSQNISKCITGYSLVMKWPFRFQELMAPHKGGWFFFAAAFCLLLTSEVQCQGISEYNIIFLPSTDSAKKHEKITELQLRLKLIAFVGICQRWNIVSN